MRKTRKTSNDRTVQAENGYRNFLYKINGGNIPIYRYFLRLSPSPNKFHWTFLICGETEELSLTSDLPGQVILKLSAKLQVHVIAR